MKCETCSETTKLPAGFYDRQQPDGTLAGGVFYKCLSETCPVAVEAMAAFERECDRVIAAKRENAANGVYPEDARQERIAVYMTGRDMAEALGVSPVQISNWEHERDPFPLDMYRRYMAVTEEKEGMLNG